MHVHGDELNEPGDVTVQEVAGGVGGVGAEEADGLTDEGPAEAAPWGVGVAEQRQEVAVHHRGEDDGYKDSQQHSRHHCTPSRCTSQNKRGTLRLSCWCDRIAGRG